MKRILLSLMMAGGFAMMAAPMARAAGPAECGKTYAILVQGNQQSTNRATGGAGLPGALTASVGVGSVTFGALGSAGATGCDITQGEFMYNSGDVQTNPAGISVGPAVCYSSASALGTGLPCFDGGAHMTGSIAPSANDGNSLQLSFVADYAWIDGSDTTGVLPLGFTVQNNTGGSIGVGTSNPASGAPVLTITLQKIGTSTGSDPAVPTVFGTAPYLGDVALSCNAWGANDTDFVAGLNDAAPEISGAFQSTVGALEVFNAGQAGGSLSFNGNDSLGATTTPPSNDDCSFSDLPGNECSVAIPGCTPEPAAYGFADGTSNSIAFVTGTGNNCGDAHTAGAGYATSAVAWGTTYSSNYISVTGLVSTATGFVPPGGESFCTSYSSAPAGTISILTVPGSQTVTAPGTKSSPIKVTSTTPADCDIEASLTPVSAPQVECSASLTTGSFDVNGGTINTSDAVNCTCTHAPTPAETDTYTLSFSSVSCPIHSGAGPITFTCKN